ncbi:hypothetical protein GTU79_26770 [Sodalis ligni]|uniref:hypothetical protein n=1 Tax=Sodalis ligni TaxID=2697027 RepID=UPI00193FF83F|nr:hypothetical protein [Sodalis ligni]QWA10732.1 hypothetical protein GTU79_26770 [Sodalis ligni]
MNDNTQSRGGRVLLMALALLMGGSVLMAPGIASGADQTQSIEDRLRLQLRSTSQQLQALQAAQAQMQAARNAAEAQNAVLQDQIKSLQAERDKAADQNKTLAQQQDAVRSQAQSQVEASQQQVGQFKQAYDQLLGMAKNSEAQRISLQTQLAQQKAALASCGVKNQRLYELGNEVLKAYEGLGTGSLIKIREPFATTSRVKFDEIAQSYGDKLYENRADARQPVAAAATAQKK